ncbi:hypothetical protein RQP46_001814 [Phenoliferia psychrophenolica]
MLLPGATGLTGATGPSGAAACGSSSRKRSVEFDGPSKVGSDGLPRFESGHVDQDALYLMESRRQLGKRNSVSKRGGYDPFLGEIAIVGFTFAPPGYALASGQLLLIAQNQALFSLFGVQYGGNGVSTFGLPNLNTFNPGCQNLFKMVALQGIFPSRS